MNCSENSCGCGESDVSRRAFLQKSSRGLLLGFGIGTTTVMLGREKAWASGCGTAAGPHRCGGTYQNCYCEGACGSFDDPYLENKLGTNSNCGLQSGPFTIDETGQPDFCLQRWNYTDQNCCFPGPANPNSIHVIPANQSLEACSYNCTV